MTAARPPFTPEQLAASNRASKAFDQHQQLARKTLEAGPWPELVVVHCAVCRQSMSARILETNDGPLLHVRRDLHKGWRSDEVDLLDFPDLASFASEPFFSCRTTAHGIERRSTWEELRGRVREARDLQSDARVKGRRVKPLRIYV